MRHYLDKVKNGLNKSLGQPRTLNYFQEAELVTIIIEMKKSLFGLTKMEIRHLVYRFSKANCIPHKFNKKRQCAGEDWICSFLKSNPILFLRKLELTSMAR